ncbi:hypothetical protein V8E36_002508 [Tilletia maclaganii]
METQCAPNSLNLDVVRRREAGDLSSMSSRIFCSSTACVRCQFGSLEASAGGAVDDLLAAPAKSSSASNRPTAAVLDVRGAAEAARPLTAVAPVVSSCLVVPLPSSKILLMATADDKDGCAGAFSRPRRRAWTPNPPILHIFRKKPRTHPISLVRALNSFNSTDCPLVRAQILFHRVACWRALFSIDALCYHLLAPALNRPLLAVAQTRFCTVLAPTFGRGLDGSRRRICAAVKLPNKPKKVPLPSNNPGGKQGAASGRTAARGPIDRPAALARLQHALAPHDAPRDPRCSTRSERLEASFPDDALNQASYIHSELVTSVIRLARHKFYRINI